MLGVLVFTILGIALTLTGFGYLMQLLIDQLGAGSKLLLMVGAAIFVQFASFSYQKQMEKMSTTAKGC